VFTSYSVLVFDFTMKSNQGKGNKKPIPDINFTSGGSVLVIPSGSDDSNRKASNETDATSFPHPKEALIAQEASRCTYTNFSRDTSSESVRGRTSKDLAHTFPIKLHGILSNPEFQDIIAWLPHGRAWRILQHKAFEEKVIPMYFRHGRYSSFARQVNGWGFRRITHGPDYNAYYHEMFLRGLPHLCSEMKRLTPRDINKNQKDDSPLPDFCSLSRDHPLPEASSTVGKTLLPIPASVPGTIPPASFSLGNQMSTFQGPAPAAFSALAGLNLSSLSSLFGQTAAPIPPPETVDMDSLDKHRNDILQQMIGLISSQGSARLPAAVPAPTASAPTPSTPDSLVAALLSQAGLNPSILAQLGINHGRSSSRISPPIPTQVVSGSPWNGNAFPQISNPQPSPTPPSSTMVNTSDLARLLALQHQSIAPAPINSAQAPPQVSSNSLDLARLLGWGAAATNQTSTAQSPALSDTNSMTAALLQLQRQITEGAYSAPIQAQHPGTVPIPTAVNPDLLTLQRQLLEAQFGGNNGLLAALGLGTHSTNSGGAPTNNSNGIP
jgi:hypothetical protein